MMLNVCYRQEQEYPSTGQILTPSSPSLLCGQFEQLRARTGNMGSSTSRAEFEAVVEQFAS